jgi:hypothetical protein
MECSATDLLCDDPSHAWSAMPESVYGDAGAHVEVFSLFAVPYLAARASHEDDGRSAVRGERVSSIAGEFLGDVLGHGLIGVRGRGVRGVGLLYTSMLCFAGAVGARTALEDACRLASRASRRSLWACCAAA